MTRVLDELYRWRLVVLTAAVGILLLGAALATFEAPASIRSAYAGLGYAALTAAAIALVAMALRTPRGRDDREPRALTAPVRGRWLAVNSPATKVPSHGIHTYGQSHAIDLVHRPEGVEDPAERGMLAPTAYVSFGQPVVAMSDGIVVAASDWRRDHRGRTSAAALVYLTLEGMVRSIGGPAWVVGNHVTIRTDDGAYALVAHLRRSSLRVQVGERVTAGQHLADCGNSGNSTEPHVHAQLMDRSSLWVARGMPISFPDSTVEPAEDARGDSAALDEADRPAGVPVDGGHLVAGDIGGRAGAVGR